MLLKLYPLDRILSTGAHFLVDFKLSVLQRCIPRNRPYSSSPCSSASASGHPWILPVPVGLFHEMAYTFLRADVLTTVLSSVPKEEIAIVPRTAVSISIRTQENSSIENCLDPKYECKCGCTNDCIRNCPYGETCICTLQCGK